MLMVKRITNRSSQGSISKRYCLWRSTLWFQASWSWEAHRSKWKSLCRRVLIRRHARLRHSLWLTRKNHSRGWVEEREIQKMILVLMNCHMVYIEYVIHNEKNPLRSSLRKHLDLRWHIVLQGQSRPRFEPQWFPDSQCLHSSSQTWKTSEAKYYEWLHAAQ